MKKIAMIVLSALCAATLVQTPFAPPSALTDTQAVPDTQPAFAALTGSAGAEDFNAAAEPVLLTPRTVSETEPEPAPDLFLATYIPEDGALPEQIIDAYFEQQYIAYASHTAIDLSHLVDTTLSRMRNTLAWFELLIQRRRLLDENDLCYVDTRMLPYEIIYIDDDDIDDGRVDYWEKAGITYKNEVMFHFEIRGEPGEAYPPMMALNAQHTIRLRRDESGNWKISFHYYPGSVRKFLWLEPLEVPDDDEALDALIREFEWAEAADLPDIPDGAAVYDGLLAAEYARRYTESLNPDFYSISDWIGNCANFTSQCIWSGFAGETVHPDSGVNMNDLWYAGDGGGSPAWENVGHFWDFATGDNAMKGQELTGASVLIPGDLIQTRSGDMSAEDETLRYNHSLVVVDGETLLLAQNSPGAFVYYSDLVNVETRFFRPVYFRS
ncbi:MAG: amidase domain-containing protein [Oscillospiraceae bacterium]|jgi:hypothetical protein|nr:amidase domain-containing protein [Oscillospiraceae bacterium]